MQLRIDTKCDTTQSRYCIVASDWVSVVRDVEASIAARVCGSVALQKGARERQHCDERLAQPRGLCDPENGFEQQTPI